MTELAACDASSLPTAVEPVNPILRTVSLDVSSLPVQENSHTAGTSTGHGQLVACSGKAHKRHQGTLSMALAPHRDM